MNYRDTRIFVYSKCALEILQPTRMSLNIGLTLMKSWTHLSRSIVKVCLSPAASSLNVCTSLRLTVSVGFLSNRSISIHLSSSMVAPSTKPWFQLEAIVTDKGWLSVLANVGIAIKARSGKRVDFMMNTVIKFDSVNVFKSSFVLCKSMGKNGKPGLLALYNGSRWNYRGHRADQTISPMFEGQAISPVFGHTTQSPLCSKGHFMKGTGSYIVWSSRRCWSWVRSPSIPGAKGVSELLRILNIR